MFVFINAHKKENQVLSVCEAIRKRGFTPLIFERYRRDHFISYFISNAQIKARAHIEGKSYSLDYETFPSVWSRIKPIVASEIPGETSELAEKFCVYEWKPALSSLDTFLSKSFWINNSISNSKISQKPHQLSLAIESGLYIPNTVITNNYLDVLPLFEEGRVVYKTLSSFYTQGEAIYTNEVSEALITKSAENITTAPGIYQTLIEKSHELRVMVVGENIFTVRINSQHNPKTTLDWRRQPLEEMYEPDVLSKDTEHSLMKFHKKADIVYAAYDFVVDRYGRELFLECNPTGQWLWLESKLPLNVCEAMANELSRNF